MAIQTHHGARYEILFASDPAGFSLELYRLRRFRSPKHVATVWRSENEDPGYKIYIDAGIAPKEFANSFVEDAKMSLQKRWEEWVQNFPELRN